jgi:hypothetical protein
VEGAKHSEFGPVVRFAYGLQKDISAVAAAVDTSWKYRPGGGPGKPTQNDQTPDVWSRWIRTSPCPRVAVLASGGRWTGPMTCIKIAEEPNSEYRTHLHGPFRPVGA